MLRAGYVMPRRGRDMTYLEYFELSQEPFSNAPVSRFYYNSTQHSSALTRLLHTVSYMKGLSVLIGDIGAGKTTLARRMLDSLPEDEYEAALLVIIHSGITANWLLKRIALQLGVENPAQEKLALLSQLYQRLLQIYEQGKKAVVLIDEAQMLETRELMEEFRGLLNLEVPERKLISFVFFGLPEIEKNLRLDPPLAQRVAMRYRLEPFNADSTEAYIKHRLRLAGCPRMPFLPDAIEALHRRSGGTPRVINTLCDNALFEAFLGRTADIGGVMVDHIADNLGLETGLHGKNEPQPGVAFGVPAFVPAASAHAASPKVGLPPVAVRLSDARPTPPVRPVVPVQVPPQADAGLAVAAARTEDDDETDLEIITTPTELPVAVNGTAATPPAPVRQTMAMPFPAMTPVRQAMSSAPAAAHPVAAARQPAAHPPVAVNAPGAAANASAALTPPGPVSPPGAGSVTPPAAAHPSDAVNAAAPAASGAAKPARGVDLAEIDRYLEGLNKL